MIQFFYIVLSLVPTTRGSPRGEPNLLDYAPWERKCTLRRVEARGGATVLAGSRDLAVKIKGAWLGGERVDTSLTNRQSRRRSYGALFDEPIGSFFYFFLVSFLFWNKLEWSNENIIEFLDLYEAEPVIWNPQHEKHKDRNAVYDAWKCIMSKFSIECSVAELKKKKG